MDLQRSLLIGAIAVLSFMLLTKWVDFKDADTSAQIQENARLISADPATAAPDLPLPAAEETGEDLPTITDSTAPAATNVEEIITESGRVIQIHTDVLQIAIDLQGGDIIELALPKYPAELESHCLTFCWSRTQPGPISPRVG